MGFFSKLAGLFAANHIDEDFYEELEENMIMGDMGVETTESIIEELRYKVDEKRIKEPSDCVKFLKESIRDHLTPAEDAYAFEKEPPVILVVGVNGVGKTTSVGKMACLLKAQGKKVLMGACDTFRAAAEEQLSVWAERAGVDIISGAEGSDPSAVLYDALAAAKARKADVLICDTAGRLHNKKNLMEELKKMHRVIEREFPEAHRENILVLDATTGQNAMAQAREFSEACELSGIILTKMDGTAKGGIAVAITHELEVPVKYIGVGEKLEDFRKFDPDAYVDSLFEGLQV